MYHSCPIYPAALHPPARLKASSSTAWMSGTSLDLKIAANLHGESVSTVRWPVTARAVWPCFLHILQPCHIVIILVAKARDPKIQVVRKSKEGGELVGPIALGRGESIGEAILVLFVGKSR